MLTVNMAAYDAWEQMINKPKWFQAWQSMAQAYDLIGQSDYLNYLYA